MSQDEFIQNLLDEKKIDYTSFRQLSHEVRKMLLDYQKDHVLQLANVIRKKFIALDGSDTGTGKTYAAIAVAKELGLRPLIVCPKVMIPIWKAVCKLFGVKWFDVVNYETLRNGKTYDPKGTGKRVKTTYLKVKEITKDITPEEAYKWKLPENILVIFDEVHKCRESGTYNSFLLTSLRTVVLGKQARVLLLSATVSEDATQMKNIF